MLLQVTNCFHYYDSSYEGDTGAKQSLSQFLVGSLGGLAVILIDYIASSCNVYLAICPYSALHSTQLAPWPGQSTNLSRYVKVSCYLT